MTGTERTTLVERFRERGYELWVVGGALRDQLLGLAERGDVDYATSALPDEVEAVATEAGLHTVGVGKRYGTIGVQIDGRWSEITTFRGDSYSEGSRWPDVTFGSSIAEDLARRDFTINALAEDAFTGKRLDLYGGADDLARRLIRAVGEPESRFREDPLRILRGFRFASQLDFEVEPATLEGMRRTVDLIPSLSQERVTAELTKLLAGARPSKGLGLLLATGALPCVLPELLPMPGCEQNRFHHYDVWGHTLATVDAMELGENGSVRRWAALVHDLGKPTVRHRKKNGEWGFYRHETVGGELAQEMLGRLKLGHRDAETIELLVRRHMERPELDDRRSIRRFMAKCEGHWRDLVALKRADNASHTYDDTAYHDALEAACERAETEDAEALLARSPLDGNELVAVFGREPGPWIRRVKEELSARVLDGDLAPGDRERALAIARSIVEGT